MTGASQIAPRLLLLPALLFFGAARGEAADYHARVRGAGDGAPGHVSLEGRELRTAPGTLGDPLRAISLLPGVAVPMPLLPLFAIRGASPGMSGFLLDGMRLPQLFHVFSGSAVVHGALIESIDFYPGAYDASFGRQAGGVVSARTRPARGRGQHGEGEVRLFDASLLADLSLGKELRVVAAGRYGYPGLIVSAVDPRVSVTYWDYYLRLEVRGLSLLAMGSYDAIAISRSLVDGDLSGLSVNDTRLSFHRLQLRYVGRRGPVAFEAAAVAGMDEQVAFDGSGVRKLAIGARGNLAVTWRRLRLRAGIEGELSSFEPQNILSAAGAVTDKMRMLDPVSAPVPLEIGEIGTVRSGGTASAYAELVADLFPGRLSVTLGLRLDVYHADRFTLLGLDPRAQLRLRVTDWLQVQAGVGMYQQPPSFPVPLPGLDTFALRLGLQRALHAALGQELRLPRALTLSVTGFYQRYGNASDFVLFGLLGCPAPKSPHLTGLTAEWIRPSDGAAYGGELLLRRHFGVVTGWIAYTLSRSERRYGCGIRPTAYDQPHVLNVVIQARLPWRLVAGVRLLFASGRPIDTGPEQGGPDNPPPKVPPGERFPDYVQLDLRLDRQWQFRRFALGLFLEVANVTYSEMTLFRRYENLPGTEIPDWRRPKIEGFRWVLPSIGIRGSF